MESESKKPRLDGSVTAATSSRRSQRQRRVRGEKEITVSCDQTLLDLKREVLFIRFILFSQYQTKFIKTNLFMIPLEFLNTNLYSLSL